MQLDAVPAGRTVVLGALQLPPLRVRRLAELGLRRGQSVAVLHRTAGGGRLLGVGDSRVAVDRATLRTLSVLESSAELADRPLEHRAKTGPGEA